MPLMLFVHDSSLHKYGQSLSAIYLMYTSYQELEASRWYRLDSQVVPIRRKKHKA